MSRIDNLQSGYGRWETDRPRQEFNPHDRGDARGPERHESEFRPYGDRREHYGHRHHEHDTHHQHGGFFRRFENAQHHFEEARFLRRDAENKMDEARHLEHEADRAFEHHDFCRGDHLLDKAEELRHEAREEFHEAKEETQMGREDLGFGNCGWW